MVKYVLVIREDICSAYNKDEAAINKLLEVAHKFGDVVSYEDAVAIDKKEMQSVIDNLNTQLTVLQAVKLTEPEKAMVNAFRDCKAASDREFVAEIDKLKAIIEQVKNKFNVFTTQIKDCVRQNENDK